MEKWDNMRCDEIRKINHCDGFGLAPLKKEGEACHPDTINIGSDEQYLRQLQAYADWHGVATTRNEICSRCYLLEKLKEKKEDD